MPQLRHDPIQRRWVIIAADRSQRPTDFQVEPNFSSTRLCPFCYGNEDKTPPEISAYRPDGSSRDSAGWEVRVVPNKFPALRVEGELEKRGQGIYDIMNGIGAHEVIIESPSHTDSFPEHTVEHIEQVMRTCLFRIQDLKRDTRFKYILLFKNHGKSAGASLEHPHLQLIATPVTPHTVALELDSALRHFKYKERCIFCDIIQQEISDGERMIYDDGSFVAFTPYASRFPFEIMFAPKKHNHSIVAQPDELFRPMSVALKEVFTRLKKALNDPPFNWVLHTAPNVNSYPPRPGYWGTLAWDYHWHIEIMPRLVKTAGFERGTGFYINPTPPEVAASYLREIKI